MVAATLGEGELLAMLSERSGLSSDWLWVHVHDVPRGFGLAWPLTQEQAEEVLTSLTERLRRVLPAPRRDGDRPGSDWRYRYLSEITDHYQDCGTRRIVDRVLRAGVAPASLALGGTYDPRSEPGWGARPSTAPDGYGTPSWAWWRAVREAGPRPLYRMPDPYVGEDEPPVDRALGLRERSGDLNAYREVLTSAVREDPRQIDCWAHLGNDALDRADEHEAPSAALFEALRFYQTAVAVAELSLPPAFNGVLAFGELDNRPFHRGLRGLALTWWRLGEPTKAAAVFGNCLWVDPDDRQGVRYVIKQVKAGVPWHEAGLD